MHTGSKLTLLLDVGKVLLDFDKELAFNALAALCGLSPKEVEKALENEKLEFRFETGKLTPGQFADELRRVLRTQASDEDLRKAWCRIFTVNGNFPRQIAHLCEQNGVPVRLFSDTDPWRAREMEELLRQHFPREKVNPIYSFEERSLKADGFSLRRVVRELARSRQQAILLDDMPNNCLAAREEGALSIRFDGEPAMAALKQVFFIEKEKLTPDDVDHVVRAAVLRAEINAIKQAMENAGVDRATTRVKEVMARCGLTAYRRENLLEKPSGKVTQGAIEILECCVSGLRKEFSGIGTLSPSQKNQVALGDEIARIVRPAVSSLLAGHYEEALRGRRDVRVFGNPMAPLIAQVHWLPSLPIPLGEIDRNLEWTPTFPTAKRLMPLFETRRQLLMDQLNDEEKVAQKARNDLTFRLLDVKGTAAAPRLVFTSSRYAAYVDSCEALLWEAAIAYSRTEPPSASKTERDVRELMEHAPWRRQIADVFDLRNRDATAGVNTLCVIVGEQKAVWLLHQRSGTMEAVGLKHVLPAGTFQPFMQGDQDHDFEFRLTANVFREFCEEVLCREKEMRELRQNTSWAMTMDEFYRLPSLAQTATVFEPFFSGAFGSNWFLGLGLDVCTLKPEILTLLIVDRRKLSELVPALPWTNLEGPYTPRTFDRETLQHFANGGDPSEPMLAAGSAAIERVLTPEVWAFVGAEVNRIRNGG